MDEKLPKRKMPEFEIGKEQMENLKTVAAVTKMLTEDKMLAREIADVFKQVAIEKDRELIDRVTNVLAQRVKEVSAEQIRTAFNYWYIWYLPPEDLEFVWHTGWRVCHRGPLGWHV
jgi:hypothetical protein